MTKHLAKLVLIVGLIWSGFAVSEAYAAPIRVYVNVGVPQYVHPYYVRPYYRPAFYPAPVYRYRYHYVGNYGGVHYRYVYNYRYNGARYHYVYSYRYRF